jgi:ABC-type transport system involved in multi-copper enzyme maturation permease subunit
MNARIATLRQAPWHEWASQAWAVSLYELRRLRRGKHSLGRLTLICVPLLFAVMAALVLAARADQAFVDPLIIDGQRNSVGGELQLLAVLFRFLNLPIIVYIASASLFGNLYHAEIADRTLHHLFLMPVRREVVTIGKFIAGVLTVFVSAVVAWLLAGAVLLSVHGPRAAITTLLSGEGVRHVLAYVAMLLLAVLTYGALFLLVGALVKSPSMIAAAVLGWEWLTIFLPTGFKRLTVVHWVTAFMPSAVTTDSVIATLADPESRLVAVPVLLSFAAACLVIATWRARHVQISYGASE